MICLFDYSYLHGGEVVSHCDFDVHFPEDNDAGHLLTYLSAIGFPRPFNDVAQKCPEKRDMRPDSLLCQLKSLVFLFSKQNVCCLKVYRQSSHHSERKSPCMSVNSAACVLMMEFSQLLPLRLLVESSVS